MSPNNSWDDYKFFYTPLDKKRLVPVVNSISPLGVMSDIHVLSLPWIVGIHAVSKLKLFYSYIFKPESINQSCSLLQN